MDNELLQLETALASRLEVAADDPMASAATYPLAIRWSERAWQVARDCGPFELSADVLQWGLQLAQRPVFISGAHRSGTTLVHDLLDSHVELCVLPSEGSYYTTTASQLDRHLESDRIRVMTCEWLRRLANGINQPPWWLLGRSHEQGSPYVDFARAMLAWWPVAAEHYAGSTALWPLVAVMLAYARSLPSSVRCQPA